MISFHPLIQDQLLPHPSSHIFINIVNALNQNSNRRGEKNDVGRKIIMGNTSFWVNLGTDNSEHKVAKTLIKITLILEHFAKRKLFCYSISLTEIEGI